MWEEIPMVNLSYGYTIFLFLLKTITAYFDKTLEQMELFILGTQLLNSLDKMSLFKMMVFLLK